MTDSFSADVLIWLGTYTLHSTLILGGLWLFERCCGNSSIALRETLWRTGILAALVTASLQTSGIAHPLLGRFEISIAQTEPTDSMLEPAEPEIDRPPLFAPDRPLLSDNPSSQVTSDGLQAAASTVRPMARPPTPPWLPILLGAETLLALWVAGALLLGLRLLSTARAARDELADREPVLDGEAFERIQLLARRAGLKRLPRVSVSGRIDGPLTLPNGEICIPRWTPQKLSTAQLDAMLAHELGHVVRRDALWLVAGLGLQTVFFFQPLNALARKRLTALSELSADEWAAAHTDGGRALAECLAEFAEIAMLRPAPVFAAGIATSESSLVQRIKRLLDGRIGRGALPMQVRFVIAIGALFLAGLIPGLMAQTSEPAGGAGGTRSGADEAPERTVLSGQLEQLEQQFELLELQEAIAQVDPASSTDPLGAIDAIDAIDPIDPIDPIDLPDPLDPLDPLDPVDPLDPLDPLDATGTSDGNGFRFTSSNSSNDCTGVLSFLRRCRNEIRVEGSGAIELAPNGSGILSISNGGHLDVTLTRDGTSRRIRVEGRNGGIESEFMIDGAGQPWDAEARAFVLEVMPLLFRTTGLSAEARLEWLLDNGGPDALLDEIGLIRSDSVQRLYTVLYGETGRIPAPYFERLTRLAGDGIGSDTNLRGTLESLYATQQPSGEALESLIRAGETIGSDANARALLDAVGPSLPNTSSAVGAYLSVARGIGSDANLAAALSTVLPREDLADEHIARIIDLAGRSIGSDANLGDLLNGIARRVGSSDTLARAYTDATLSIGSDNWARATLTQLASDADLSAEGWRMLLDAAITIGSDANCAALLTAIADDLPRDEETLSAYRRALATIGSESNRRRATQALGSN